ncbi:proline--tRNA ligase [Pseudobdellovibrio exovorus]|uniref:Proline--tRNA ligase n=1 Tax=Pseudobdellovibrio exovorus JSS TaxID=1184267 RepID=M4VCD6_9BACT|nr:proline--tRNA ligase [Pseudobdellovibrio exovorus]AGH96145.1 prolyl-tRNA synthetase [Pseudobdellovibrio exovorus JSS]
MKWTKTHLYTLKEAPSDAEIPSHKLLVRSGFMKKLAPGLYTYGAMALRAIRKFENIIREELDKDGAIEILMPVVHPKELWMETNRWNEMGAGLLKFKNRNNHEFCLGATHEEAVVDYVRHDLKSYRDLPKNIYQIQTKYRDEIRPRFGLMRGREFSMKDAYSFDLDQEGALKTYDSMYKAYQRIFDRLGLQYRIVQADAGNIGGSQTHEFQLLADAGEDALLVSDKTQFAANIEVCPAIDVEVYQPASQAELPIEKFATPHQKTIADLEKFTGIRAFELVKTLYFSANEDVSAKDSSLKAFAVLLRGSDEVNPIKVKNLLGMTNPPQMLTDEEVRQVTGANPGSCGPVGLKIPIYADNGIQNFKNYIVGANEDGFHLKNVNHGRDYQVTQFADLRMAKEGDKCPESDGRLKSYRGIEVGHVFYLGQKYARKMNGVFLDKNGKSQFYEMGCYGIGVTRTVQASIEQSHDQDGIIWPMAIAPYHVHICHLDPKDAAVNGFVEAVAKELESKGVEVFIDDRDERPGVKFKDADLLGFPVRIVVGKKGLEGNQIEVVLRRTKEVSKLAQDQVVQKALDLLEQAK